MRNKRCSLAGGTALTFVLVVGLRGFAAPHVLVADFAVHSTLIVSRQSASNVVADAVREVIERDEPGSCVASEQTSKQIALREFAYPLNALALTDLGRFLECDAVVFGSVITKPLRRQQVALQSEVEWLDLTVGSVVRGAVAFEVVDLRRQSLLEPEWAQRATDLARKAARDMLMRPVITGQVLAADSQGTIYLNIGSEDGLRKGMRLIVMHKTFVPETQKFRLERVGEIRVTETTAHDGQAVSVGRLRGVQSLDTITAAFDLRAARHRAPIKDVPEVR